MEMPPLPPDLPVKPAKAGAAKVTPKLVAPHVFVLTVTWSNAPMNFAVYTSGLLGSTNLRTWSVLGVWPMQAAMSFRETNPPSPRYYRAFNGWR